MKHTIIFLISFLASCSLNAQETGNSRMRRLVVADIETKVPMRGVIVSTKTGYRDTTNWRGICQVPVEFDTLTIFKHGYIPERLVQGELRDSTFLIPEGTSIGQVTVWGKNHFKDNVNEWKRNTPVSAPSNGTVSIGFDFANMIDKRGRRDRKHLRITREKFKEMDTSGDPIVDAYKKALEEAKLKKEKELEEAEQKQAAGNQDNKTSQSDPADGKSVKKNNSKEEKKQ